MNLGLGLAVIYYYVIIGRNYYEEIREYRPYRARAVNT